MAWASPSPSKRRRWRRPRRRMIAVRLWRKHTLVFDRSRDLEALAAYNTDFDGVLTPIKRLTEEDGLRVAVIGNGGAARGAVDALRTSGAHVKLFPQL